MTRNIPSKAGMLEFAPAILQTIAMGRRASLILLLVFLHFCVGEAFAGEVYKCRNADGVVSYSDSPCPDGKKIQTKSSSTSGLARLTQQQADIAFDCIELLADIEKARARGSSQNAIESLGRSLVYAFEKYCPALGFKSPLDSSTLQFNAEHVNAMNAALERGSHTGPSYQRVYSGGGRNPPLISTAATAGNARSRAVDEWPDLRHGIWRIETPTNKVSVEQECVSPVVYLKGLAEYWEKNFGCDLRPVKQIAGGARMAIHCPRMKSNGTETLNVDGSLTVMVQGTDNFTTQERFQTFTLSRKGTRVADCEKATDAPVREAPAGPRLAPTSQHIQQQQGDDFSTRVNAGGRGISETSNRWPGRRSWQAK